MEKTEFKRCYRKQAVMSEKWVSVWNEIEQQFTGLPKWAQQILLDDITATSQIRIAAMKRAYEAGHMRGIYE